MMRMASSVETASMDAEAGFCCSVRSFSSMSYTGRCARPLQRNRQRRRKPYCTPHPLYTELVRYFLSRQIPPTDAILLVESGSRSLVEKVIPGLRETWGDEIPIDL